MKCIAIKDVKEFELKDIKEPIKEDNKVMISVKKTGICGSDIHYWESGQPKGLVMGHEFCGTVIDPGNRKDLNIGDRVTALPILFRNIDKCDWIIIRKSWRFNF